MDSGNKEDIVPLQKDYRTEHIRPILKRRTKLKSEPISDENISTNIRPVLRRRKTSTPIIQSRSSSNEPMRQKQCAAQRPVLKRRSKTTKPVINEVKSSGEANKPIAQQQAFTFRPILKRRSKFTPICDPNQKNKKKERSKERKIKKIIIKNNININYLLLYNNLDIYKIRKFQNTTYPVFSNFLERFFPKNEKTTKEHNGGQGSLSTKNKRSLLNYQEDYAHYKKEPIKDGKPTKNTLLIFKIWDGLVKRNTKLASIGDKRKNTKKYRDTCSAVRAFIDGTLLINKLVILPNFANNIEFTKNTPEDFKQYLATFEALLNWRTKNKFLFKFKIDLLFFVAGHGFLRKPSILLEHCWEEPQNFGFNNEEYFPVLKDTWEDLTGNKITMQDRKNFDIYLEWGLLHFKSLKKGLNSMNDFDDELDVLEFFTFGVLRQMKEKGRSFSSGILNQDFFKVMMEELRQFHRYVV